MAHMQKQITEKMFGWEVETSGGTEFVPGTCVFVPDWLKTDVSILDTDDKFSTETFEMLRSALHPYVEGGTIVSIQAVYGYFARMSAPGYLDCTPWVYGATQREVRDNVSVFE